MTCQTRESPALHLDHQAICLLRNTWDTRDTRLPCVITRLLLTITASAYLTRGHNITISVRDIPGTPCHA
jgi:hypothetical protein